MMTVRKLLSLVLFALVPILVCAQDVEQATEEALDTLDRMSVEVNNFVGHVRFDESDVVSLIGLYDEYTELGEDDHESDDEFDYESVLNDDAYLRWAASHGLEAEDWARKTVRIMMMVYREQVLEGAKLMPEQMAEQMAMIEEQREQLGEEVYRQMKQGMEESARYGRAVEKNARSLPKPTAAEQVTLDKYRAELVMLMESEDEDEEYYDDYDEDDEYAEDDEYDEY
ncbi:MAG: hypothetical protein KJO09_14535 [Gammaproteobacteria bacterium]|nr:hypothetical protein [Gammaproteobacteria bacterium]